MGKIVVILLLVSHMAYCQGPEVTFGIKGGGNLSSFKSETTPSTPQMNVGFFFGGIWEIPLKNRWVLQPEALYSLEILDLGIPGSEGNLKASYLRIPLLAKYYIVKGWALEAGPTAGLLIAAKMKDIDVKDNFRPFDLALSMGTSYRTKKGLILGARYNWGVVNIADIPGLGEESTTSGFQVSVGYFL